MFVYNSLAPKRPSSFKRENRGPTGEYLQARLTAALLNSRAYCSLSEVLNEGCNKATNVHDVRLAGHSHRSALLRSVFRATEKPGSK